MILTIVNSFVRHDMVEAIIGLGIISIPATLGCIALYKARRSA